PSGDYKLPNSRVQDISNFVRDNNLGDGYGTYWVASAVSLFKNGDVRPVTFTEENKAARLNWLSNKAWYGFKSRYIVTEFKHDIGFAPIFPDTCYHLTHYWPAAAD
ncbi:hypothetical protein OV760_29210, partial [Salmonella enterica subsp. enterica serovar 1,4,[5],12:i:-]|nr:hypothetical protein [Salmonella enterica subsp. enterica serovar 1,4,[5],12:i:-]